ncbi:MAG: ubiquinone/menaquinone biosynthesis methyltransferase [Gemmatimonadaceae bacterium]
MSSGGRDIFEAHEAATAEGGKDRSAGATKRAYVQRIFSEIAPRYDLLNHLFSLNIDRAWRSRALDVLQWQRVPGGTYLDLCAGTLDVAAQLANHPAFRGRVLACDFAEPMLRRGGKKVRGLAVFPMASDALALPIADNAVDGAVVAFGVRNLADLDAGLGEVRRILKPGGRFVILEFTTPRNGLVRGAYSAYFQRVLPLVGRWLSGHRTAYSYLPDSVAHFPAEEALAERLTHAGFEYVRWESLTLGIAGIHQADKPGASGASAL